MKSIIGVEALSQNPKLATIINEMDKEAWPNFLFNGTMQSEFWLNPLSKHQDFQLIFSIEDEYVGCGRTAPIFWNGKFEDIPSGYDQVVEEVEVKDKPWNTLVGLAGIVSKKHLGKGISYQIIKDFVALARKHDLTNILIPVRPTFKSKYPLVTMENYIQWKKGNWPYDPWLRVHVKLGGEILKLAEPSMIVEGKVAEWQKWTGLYFGESGEYIVPGALNPVMIDLEKDYGRYVEPNVWVLHRVPAINQ